VRSITQRASPEGAKSPKGRESFIKRESTAVEWMNRVAHDTLGRQSQAGHKVFACVARGDPYIPDIRSRIEND
jgi:hypothetical protein